MASYITIMSSLNCGKCQKYLHPVKKIYQPFCLWCLKFLNKEDPEGLVMHVFHCGNHPLKGSQKKMSALDWGQMRLHLSEAARLSGWRDSLPPICV